ncbi:hypothetical protein ACVIJ1_004972 [Bradyrhizobium elkanii]
MTTHVNKVHHVTTIAQVAKDLGEDEDWLWDIAIEMEIEHGVIWVYGVGERRRPGVHRLRNREPDRAYQVLQGKPWTAEAVTCGLRRMDTLNQTVHLHQLTGL